MINCLRIEKANEFICTTYCYIAIRAFLELLEEKNIKMYGGSATPPLYPKDRLINVKIYLKYNNNKLKWKKK